MKKNLHANRTGLVHPKSVTSQLWPLGVVATAVLAMGILSPDAHALALGRITVLSALGEPLRAEIEIPQINTEEAASLKAGVASPEAFRAAGLEYSPAMASLRVRLQRAADGRAYLILSSDRAVNEPFIDLILETSWASGRIVRDYTLLFDPPNLRQPAAVAVTPAQVSSQAPSTESPPSGAPAAPRSSPPARAPAPSAAAARPAARQPATADGQQVKVQAGDTAGRIAAAHKPVNVSLDQMLVALLRANPDAFINGNVNWIKSGAVLDLPTAEQAAATSAQEARRTIVAQSSDFNAFRRKLAESAPQTQVASANRQATGSVQTQVEDKTAATPSPDKLTLSKGSVQGKAPEALIAQSRQAKESAERVAELSKNISELSRLEAASTAAAGSPPATKSNAAPASVNLPAGLASPTAAASAPAVAATVPPTATTTAAPPVAPDASSAPAAAASAATATAPVVAASKPKPAPAKAAPVQDPSFLETLLENPLIPAAAGGLVALLVGLGLFRARQRKKTTQVDSSFLESRLQPDSFFGSSGGQHVDTKENGATGASSSMAYSPSQLDAAGDVDPVAEADVYLAYGRDLQAEEILKEALRANPSRVAIHAKLLEIYAKRRDVKAFEVLAGEAYNLTMGDGPEWEHICGLGRALDDTNPLYQPGGQTPTMAGGRASPDRARPSFAASTMPQIVQPEFAPSSSSPVDLDLDLDFTAPEIPATVAPERPVPLPTPAPVPAPAPLAAEPAPAPIMDLEMDLEGLGAPVDTDRALPAAATATPPLMDNSGMIEFDLGALSLDLDAAPDPGASTQQPDDVEEDPLTTKLSLAQEFNAIGDTDGARALAQEVVAEASGSLKMRAERFIAELG